MLQAVDAGGNLIVHQAWLHMDDDDFYRLPVPANSRNKSYFGMVLARALRNHLSVVPTEEALHAKPLLLRLKPPLPLRVRVYIFRATQNIAERQEGAFRVQLTATNTPLLGEFPKPRFEFDRSNNIRCLLIGYNPELRTFIIWDADLHDATGFTRSRGVQAPPEVVYKALATGIAERQRDLKGPNRRETIIAARPERLAEAIERRVDLSIDALLSGVIPGC
ncbi:MULTISPECIES: hypothetical protein [Streptomyces]|uniref:hypothetical protein n=2 Tax=Streptomyces TaxID=1883 RepID=UPI0029B02C3C|nr:MULTISPECIES: hypothetical protein [Streptomyces]MDX2618593.1 hypothetical protein [Streptomyces sp. WI03-5b]